MKTNTNKETLSKITLLLQTQFLPLIRVRDDNVAQQCEKSGRSQPLGGGKPPFHQLSCIVIFGAEVLPVFVL